ncbi:hypothetical protein HDV05_005673 [Chytridiales sp. JEL 0842]|nr:hypothetical protein HDV05_005673 [Chytridiales sp. JEL 0842]
MFTYTSSNPKEFVNPKAQDNLQCEESLDDLIPPHLTQIVPPPKAFYQPSFSNLSSSTAGGLLSSPLHSITHIQHATNPSIFAVARPLTDRVQSPVGSFSTYASPASSKQPYSGKSRCQSPEVGYISGRTTPVIDNSRCATPGVEKEEERKRLIEKTIFEVRPDRGAHKALFKCLRKSPYNVISSENGYHRQTYHLAVAFLDFYLSKSSSVTKDTLQILGATMLYLASKIEEPEPLPISELLQFEFYENNVRTRYSHPEVLQFEQIFIERSGGIAAPTAHDWLLIYYQHAALMYPGYYADLENNEFATPVLGDEDAGDDDEGHCQIKVLNEMELLSRRFVLTSFKAAVVELDQLILDIDSLKFPYSLLAAGVFSRQVKLENEEVFIATGYTQPQLTEVLGFIQAFVTCWNKTEAKAENEGDFYRQTRIALTSDDLMEKWDDTYLLTKESLIGTESPTEELQQEDNEAAYEENESGCR